MSRMCPRHLKNRKAQAAARPDRSSRTRAKRVPAHRSGTLLADGTALRTNRAARLNPLMHSFALSVLCSTHELWQSEYVRFPVWLLLRTLTFGTVLFGRPSSILRYRPIPTQGSLRFALY